MSYFYVREESAGGEVGLLQPEVQYVYDLAVPEEIIPKPNDNEVDSFSLMPLLEVCPRRLRLIVGARASCSGRIQAELRFGFIRLLRPPRHPRCRQRKRLPPDSRSGPHRPSLPAPIGYDVAPQMYTRQPTDSDMIISLHNISPRLLLLWCQATHLLPATCTQRRNPCGPSPCLPQLHHKLS